MSVIDLPLKHFRARTATANASEIDRDGGMYGFGVINGAVAAINAGLDNPYRICKETGRGEYEENIDQIARAREYAEAKGVPLNYVMQPVETVADDTQDRNTRGRA